MCQKFSKTIQSKRQKDIYSGCAKNRSIIIIEFITFLNSHYWYRTLVFCVPKYMIGLFGSRLLHVQSRVYLFIVYSIMLMEALTDRVV